MTTTTRPVSELTAAIVNPLMSATNDVFSMMLGCKPTRNGLSLKSNLVPSHDLSAVIGVTGKAVGTIVFSVARETAFAIVDRMLGMEVTEINTEVRDAVGEVTNMIAGAAKAKLESLNLSISIPNIVSGVGHEVHYPTGIVPICLSFQSEIGPFSVEAGFSPVG